MGASMIRVYIFRSVEGHQKEPKRSPWFLSENRAMDWAHDHQFYDPRTVTDTLSFYGDVNGSVMRVEGGDPIVEVTGKVKCNDCGKDSEHDICEDCFTVRRMAERMTWPFEMHEKPMGDE